MTSTRVFFAYPSDPPQLGQCVESAAAHLRKEGVDARTWTEMDIAGKFIASGVMKEIEEADVVVVDITRLNFNVTFEAGYALAKNKRIIPTVNSSLSPPHKEITQLGLFDTLGYKSYQNANQLASAVASVISQPLAGARTYDLDRSAPVYILDSLHKTDASLRITSKVKKTKIRFRSFDPKEQPRLSANDAYHNVAQSVAVIVSLLSSQSTDYERNNLRAAFLIGLSFGMEKETLVFQDGNEPVPLDYRDFVIVYKKPADIDPRINDLAPRVMEALQKDSGSVSHQNLGTLEQLDLGDPAAENEMSNLGEYYVRTDEFNKTLAGSVRLVVGRKGVGKTALFLQVRDKKRSDRQKVVLDLRPEGHQLKRFKNVVLDVLSEAVKEHAATAFWEYSLLLEVAYKLLEKDRNHYRRDPELQKKYEALLEVYQSAGREVAGEGDFSERLRQLTEKINAEFGTRYGNKGISELTVGEVTNLIYKADIRILREILADYLKAKDEVWILFDNIDKGWPTHGVLPTDIVILRALLEASRKMEQFFRGKKLEVHNVVFVRNDVFELLVDESPDRGKESKVSLDWTDPERLRELLRKRIVHSGNVFVENSSFDTIWPQICTSHVLGDESSEYLIERSLMRPRNLLTLVSYAKSNAVNLRHPRISESDIIGACKSYSADIGNEIGLEIRDVYPSAEDILYYFIGCKPWLNLSEVRHKLKDSPVPETDRNRMIEMLLWFSFLGIVRETSDEVEEVFIYDVFYDMKKLKILAKNLKDDGTVFSIHKGFWPFLDINQ